MTNLGEQVREEGQSSLLDLGTILQEIHLLAPRPKTVFEQESEEILEEQRKARQAIN